MVDMFALMFALKLFHESQKLREPRIDEDSEEQR